MVKQRVLQEDVWMQKGGIRLEKDKKDTEEEPIEGRWMLQSLYH